MKTNKVKVMALIMALVLSLSTQMFAQPGQGFGPGKGQGQGMNPENFCLNIPDLTEDQKKSIEKLRATHQKEMLAHRNEMGELRAKLQTLRTADNANISDINATIDKITVLKNKQMKSREAHHQDIRKILTPEQRVEFDLHSPKGKGKGKGNCNGGGKGYGRF